MNKKEFIKQVDAISQKRFALAYTSENGDDCKTLNQSFEDGETPEEFVEWWGKKYDLYDFEDIM